MCLDCKGEGCVHDANDDCCQCPACNGEGVVAAVEPAPPVAREGEERWATARRVASDDHPKDCPCIRDHLETAFLLGMVEGEERATPSPAPSSAEVEAARKALRITGAMYQWTRPDSEQSRLWLEAESAFERAIRKEYE